ncbi:MAG: class I SAM-dependent methyltransferase [Clostridiales bacterium]|jgi:tRNA (cmo5U34)-methyltransferase|nr:class I SAM-dependent methyltransferase [Clostridiales bacterium]
MQLKEVFDELSQKYDAQRRQLIPCFDDFYHLPLTVMDFPGDAPRILDIGSGTGLFAAVVLQKYPNAHITCIDQSGEMLAVAQKRFFENPNVTFLEADYMTYPFSSTFDWIISALSIHHLSGEEKRKLYQTCWELLEPGGGFLNADQVASPFSSIEHLHLSLWKQAIQESGLEEAEIQAAFRRMEYDQPSTLEEQLRWLRESGFSAVDIVYKYYHFCVLYARK